MVLNFPRFLYLTIKGVNPHAEQSIVSASRNSKESHNMKDFFLIKKKRSMKVNDVLYNKYPEFLFINLND